MRRTICRWAFCLLCVMPTLGVIAGTLVVNMPAWIAWRKANLQQQLAWRLGVDVSIGAIDRKVGGRQIVRSVQLADPESGLWLARARTVEVYSSGQGIWLTVNQGEIAAERLVRLATLLHEHVLARPAAGTPIQLQATSLSLLNKELAESVLGVGCRIQDTGSETETLIQFQIPGSTESEPVRLRINRDRNVQPAANRWELHTDQTPLPCSVLAPWLLAAPVLGEDCVFTGSVWSVHGRGGWDADLRGIFQGVDLDRLVTARFPHKLSGVATVRIERAVVQQGRIVRIAGHLASQGGIISRSLLESARTNLQLDGPDHDFGVMLLRYKRMAFDFTLNDKYFTISGEPGMGTAILTDRQGPLLNAKSSGRLSPVALLALLVPQNEVRVPATKETAMLVRLLPLPERVSPESRNARSSYAPVRLRAR